MKKLLSLYLLISLIAQPLVGAEETSSKKTKIITISVGFTALVGATIAYLMLTKSDKQVCDTFYA